MNIIVIGVADLPNGTGRTSRLRTLCCAMIALGHQVAIWNEHALTNTPGQATEGELGGARFEYVLGTTKRGYGFAAIILKLRAVYAIVFRLATLPRAHRPDIIMLNSTALYDALPITLWAKMHGTRTIQCYEDERMEVVSQERLGFARRLYGWNAWLSDQLCSQMADTIIVISTYLKAKYDTLTGNPDRVVILPTIIDCDNWYIPPEPTQSKLTVLYTGALTEHDEVENIVDALALLKQEGYCFNFKIIGADPALPRTRALQQLITVRDMMDCVSISGHLSHEHVKQEIRNANILVALRRDSLWARSGQSTKLSEYLASARCVLTTPVGDNAIYLRDRENALFVDPRCRVDDITKVLRLAFDSPELRSRVAIAGRETARKLFDLSIGENLLRDIFNKTVEAGAAVRQSKNEALKP